MGSVARFPSNHSMSSRFADSALGLTSARPGDPGEENEDEDDGEGEGDGDTGVALCPVECITSSVSACHAAEEETCPSRSTVAEFTLPLRVHFRYCWLFSGVPRRNVMRQGYRGAGDEPLTDREAVRSNRALMSGVVDDELVPPSDEDLRQDGIGMRAFWLTTDGSLVCVETPSEDAKFRELRRETLRTALALWTATPALCARNVKASSAAHATLIEICGEASRLSRGRFYNLYAKYPLPVEVEAKPETGCPAGLISRRQPRHRRRYETPVAERAISFREIRTGAELLSVLKPMYAAYFDFVEDESTQRGLSDRAARLGGGWLVREERAELRLSARLRNSRLARWVTACALFVSTF